jgi:predicted permease
MIATLIGALLPVAVTLGLGAFAGWRRDFGVDQAQVLIRMITLYALPCMLFANVMGMRRDEILGEWPLAIALSVGMVASCALAYATIRGLFRRDRSTAMLQAFAMAAPSATFLGPAILGSLFGGASGIPISVGAVVINLLLVPVAIVVLSSEEARAGGGAPDGFLRNLMRAMREPIVWSPALALALVSTGLRLPDAADKALMLLGSATAGAALFAVGLVLFSYKLTLTPAVAATVAMRNLIVPGIALAALPHFAVDPAMIREAVLTLALPSNAMCTILALRYRKAESEMTSTLFLGNAVSVATVGAFILLTA